MHRKSKNKKILGWHHLGNPDLKHIYSNHIHIYTVKHDTNNLGLEQKLRAYLVLLLRNDKTRNISMTFS